MSKIVECFNSLESLSKDKGYVSFDDILDAAEEFDLSVVDVDNLSEKLQLNGIVISDEPPQAAEPEPYDYSRIDYDAVYDEIVSVAPEFEYTVNQIRKFPTPQKGEIGELFAKMEYFSFSGPEAENARERVILMHLRVVLKIALPLSKLYGYELSDAISEGFSALVDAVDKYKPERNDNQYFGSYVSQFVWGVILRECQPKWVHKIPPSLMDKLLSLIKMYKDFYGNDTELETPDNDFIDYSADKINAPVEKVKSYFELIVNENTSMSIEEYAENEDEDSNIPLLLVDYEDEWERELWHYQLRQNLVNILKTLKSNQFQILIMRYGLDNNGEGEPMTLDEIGDKLHITRERVRQIEEKALKAVRNSAYMRNLYKEFQESHPGAAKHKSSKVNLEPKVKVEKEMQYNVSRLRNDIIQVILLDGNNSETEIEINEIKKSSDTRILRLAPKYGINPENYVVYR